MGFTLAFHIVLACLGVAFPAVVLVANYLGLRRRDETALLLARRWSQVMAVLVAVGAITGTVLSFEMGLLWPGLMGRFGGAIGIPFSIEGIFFLLEAVFVSIYLYGWDRLSGWPHFCTGVPVAVAGSLGAWSVVAANSWMNQPAGFQLSHGRLTHVDPVAVFFNPATYYEVPHMILAAYMVTGFLVASVYAVGLLRGRRDRYHRLGFLVPFTIAGVCTPLQIFVGDTAARAVEHQQPLKFAAMEYVVRTHRHVSEYLGGVFVNGHVTGALKVPDLDSLLVGFSPNTKVVGWDSVPAAGRAPFVSFIHLSFDLMVLIGFGLLVLGAWSAVSWWRRRDLPGSRLFLWGGALSGLAAVVAMECGWVVTEVGRQPWIVYKVMLTSQAATTTSGLTGTLTAIIALYAVLGIATVAILLAFRRRWRQTAAVDNRDVPYGPSAGEPADRVGQRS
ncbi:MAG TPA: cytochrome ubiquinol oxidase subunit I [Mycobacteriales bacterium]|nr:cytochrome ubiquinol oxidase subunit I [Mycobacteriales bacterium]